jgi:hypothetical protein
LNKPDEFYKINTDQGSKELPKALFALDQKYQQEERNHNKNVEFRTENYWERIAKDIHLRNGYIPTLYTEEESREWLKKEDETPVEETIEVTKIKMLKHLFGLKESNSIFESPCCKKVDFADNNPNMTNRWRNIDTAYSNGKYYFIIDDCV